MKQEDSVV